MRQLTLPEQPCAGEVGKGGGDGKILCGGGGGSGVGGGEGVGGGGGGGGSGGGREGDRWSVRSHARNSSEAIALGGGWRIGGSGGGGDGLLK